MARSRRAPPSPKPNFEPADPMAGWGNFTGWDLSRIRAARDTHMRGAFRDAADLAEACKTEPTIFTALANRIAPHRGLPRAVKCSRVRIGSEAAATFAPTGPSLSSGVVGDALERMLMLGVGVGQNVWTGRYDGSRIDLVHELWPSRHLRVAPITGQLQAVTTKGLVDVVHGDGRWVVYSLHATEPWQWGAIKPLSTLWPELSHGGADWQHASEIHGATHVLGELPSGIAPDSPQGRDFAELVLGIATRARSGGLRPSGAKIDLLEANSAVWQIWAELIKQRTSEVVRVLLGQDGSIVNEGGNYIKAAMLSGVRDDLVEGDVGALSAAITTGILRPWAIANFGPSAAPDLRIEWQFPDREQDMRRKSLADREKQYTDAIIARRSAGFIVTQAWADNLADELGVARAQLLDPSGKGEPPTGRLEPAESDEPTDE